MGDDASLVQVGAHAFPSGMFRFLAPQRRLFVMTATLKVMFSILDMFKVGVGPSSSHTMGPMVAAAAFADDLRRNDVLQSVRRVQVTLYGSLSLTGLGHGTDRAVMAGLEGQVPQSVDTRRLLHIREECSGGHSLMLDGTHRIDFDYERDVVFERWQRLALHTNGMRFVAFGAGVPATNLPGQDVENPSFRSSGLHVAADCALGHAGQAASEALPEILCEQVWYSIGGGFVRRGRADDPLIGIHDDVPDGTTFAQQEVLRGHEAGEEGGDISSDSDFPPEAPFPFRSGNELLRLCSERGMSIAEIAWENEIATQSPRQVRTRLLDAWKNMQECVEAGCTSTQERLPGVLNVPRRAPRIYRKLASGSDVFHSDSTSPVGVLYNSQSAWIDLFAMAVNEENAGGGRVVTAPTNGSAGVIPAVLEYYWYFVDSADEDGVVCFLLTAGAIGYLFKRNASISGAEVGCQGEVGTACSMAAAGLCAVMGGTPRQVENAAEIGIEHHLGLTCDPVAGLVQVPCIERNAIAANTALNAVRMALLGDGGHVVSLDQAIKTMKDTGEDMMSKYKETSKGGLAVNVVEC